MREPALWARLLASAGVALVWYSDHLPLWRSVVGAMATMLLGVVIWVFFLGSENCISKQPPDEERV